MKLLVYADPHWSTYSSIVRRRGKKYSLRLQNEIDSLNWVESFPAEYDAIVCLGDFFDKPELTAEEITALSEVKWSTKKHYFIVGNHEMANGDLTYSSSELFNQVPNCDVICKPYVLQDGSSICFLPYVLEDNRKSLQEYFPGVVGKKVLLMHNDISGIQMGQFISKLGFSIEEIEEFSSICLDGHLHNGQKLSNKVFTVGNLTGQNFGEDAFLYDHCIFILDTETLHIDVYENPYALNFYKLTSIQQLKNIKFNSVITMKCKHEDIDNVRDILSNDKRVLEFRIIAESITMTEEEVSKGLEHLQVNHLEEFRKFSLQQLPNTDTLLEELEEVLR